METSLTTDVLHCARCEGDHVSVAFEALTRPIEDEDGTTWTHWAPCPANGEPILLRSAGERPRPPISDRERSALPGPLA